MDGAEVRRLRQWSVTFLLFLFVTITGSRLGLQEGLFLESGASITRQTQFLKEDIDRYDCEAK